MALLVSQSGETADTLAALRYMRSAGQHVVSVLNVPESTMARESDAVLETVAGPEIGVASTKAFTAQLTVMACLSIAVGACSRHAWTPPRRRAWCTTCWSCRAGPARCWRWSRFDQAPVRTHEPPRATCCAWAAA